MRYYIADCHFYHRALLEHMDKRGFSDVDEMNDYMIEQWNGRVRPNDEVVILGDFSWGTAAQTEDILSRLNGKKFLIRGNHDLYLKDKNFNQDLFGWVKDYEELRDNKRKVVLSHYPMICYNGQYRLDEEGNPKSYMLHGHIHQTHDQDLIDDYRRLISTVQIPAVRGDEMRSIPFNVINCFCKFSNYVPLTLDEWIELEGKRRQAADENKN